MKQLFNLNLQAKDFLLSQTNIPQLLVSAWWGLNKKFHL